MVLLFVALVVCIVLHKVRLRQRARRLDTIKLTEMRKLKLKRLPKEFRDQHHHLFVNTKYPRGDPCKVAPDNEPEKHDLPVIAEEKEVESPC